MLKFRIDRRIKRKMEEMAGDHGEVLKVKDFDTFLALACRKFLLLIYFFIFYFTITGRILAR